MAKTVYLVRKNVLKKDINMFLFLQALDEKSKAV